MVEWEYRQVWSADLALELVGVTVSSSGVWEPGSGVAEVEAAGGVEGFFGTA
jgi:hypothetical protein